MVVSLKSTVALVKTDKYKTLFEAISVCFDLLGANEKIKTARKILIKPNCLQDSPNAATDPEIIRNTILIIQKIKEGAEDYEILIGDSPGILTKSPRTIFERVPAQGAAT